jgi:hypothetical protein
MVVGLLATMFIIVVVPVQRMVVGVWCSLTQFELGIERATKLFSVACSYRIGGKFDD